MENYPAKFYNKEDNITHIVGYTLALGILATGVVETLHGFYSYSKGNKTSLLLGPAVFVAGGALAYLYLKEAKVIY
jgi:hypothetical protein|nr:hypothetical protein [uncultured Mediterranean phage uvMED]|tara:strand:+ start:3070 stop:3297 length:228 start_codon:yes stop_codon:yes gene_type:complete